MEVNHIFPAILALKMLCVHPVLLLRKAFMDPDRKKKPVQQEEENSPEQKEESDQEPKESIDGETQATKNPQDGLVEELQKQTGKLKEMENYDGADEEEYPLKTILKTIE